LRPFHKHFAQPDRAEGNHDTQKEKSVSGRVMTELDRLKNFQRQGRCFSRDISSDEDSCSEFTDRPGKGENDSGNTM